MKKHVKEIFRLKNSEAFIWTAALLCLYFIPVGGDNHFSICPLKNFGFDFCPGCGLGTSIHYFLHFDLLQSFHAHPLGLFALLVLVNRIITLLVPGVYQNKFLLFSKFKLKGENL